MHLHELAVVEEPLDHVAHVVGQRVVVRDDPEDVVEQAVGVVPLVERRGVLDVVGGEEGEQAAHLVEAGLLVGVGEVGDAGFGGVRHGAAEFLEGGLLAGDALDDVGAGDVHLRGTLDHEDEVRDRRRVDGAAGARAHDHADLRDHAGAADVAVEDVAVAGEGGDALLDARPAGVVEADHRDAGLEGEVHRLGHLLADDRGERSAVDREVLREEADVAAVDLPPAGDDGVTVEALGRAVLAPVHTEHVEFLEAAGVDERLDAFARRELLALVLRVDAILAAAEERRWPSFRPVDRGVVRGS